MGQRYVISGITGSSEPLAIAADEGVETQRIYVGQLMSGWYILTLMNGDMVIDQVKFNKR